MPPSRWDDEEDESESSGPESPPVPATTAPAVRRSKFDDEEDDDDVLDSWDAADDSETERTKAAAAAAAATASSAAAKASHKSKSQRVEEHRQENLRRRLEQQDLLDSSDDEDESEAVRLARMREMEKDADLKNAADLFGNIGVNPARATAVKPVVLSVSGAAGPAGEGSAAGGVVDLASLKLFDPLTREDFVQLRETLAPLIGGQNAKKARYAVFAADFVKELCKDLGSEAIKKVASGLTALANERMKEEKAAEKGGKKSKAAKTKTTLNAGRGVAVSADVTAYDGDGLDDGDFM